MNGLKFEIVKECGSSRRGKMKMRHGLVDTPVFMPVGTQGAIKGITFEEMNMMNCQILLSNTYHLGLRPGTNIINSFHGIHNFKGWSNNVLTDSGGFQMVSLLELAEIQEHGVKFQSPMDGTEMLLTPEKSMQLQHDIGSDIMMALDDVVPATCTDEKRFEEACYRTIRWIDRCIAVHNNEKNNTDENYSLKQNLFGIVQGGLNANLRKYCLEEMCKRDKYLPGYAIGGLCGGEAKNEFWKTVYQCTQALPKNKPRYVMGVGFPLDLVVCVALGADMFDCVYPCRTARFGTALVRSGELHLKSNQYKYDFRPIDEKCKCTTCQHYTRAYLHTVATRESTAASLLSVHNIFYLLDLMKEMRTHIEKGSLSTFVKEFMANMYPNGLKTYPDWCIDAFHAVGIDFS